MSVVIKVENLSKYYRLGVIGGGTLREDLGRWWAMRRGKPDPLLKIGEEDYGNRKDGQVWALRDISFEVVQGEILGIIGRNGAGKSTLLKILSRITAPTSGSAKIRGRVASLLEVGTGFHPELTGRENIYLNGTILGMSRREVRRKLDEIIEFAEVSKFIDTPVKRYSSGMRVRLAFAVAAHLEPEILIIDEVLAVGDAGFQRKCLGKMDEVSSEGRTVIFVSHQLGMISQLCEKAVLMDKGRIISKGPTDQIITQYLDISERRAQSEIQERVSMKISKASQIRNVSVYAESDGAKSSFKHDEEIILNVEYAISQLTKNHILSVAICDRMSEKKVFTSQTRCLGDVKSVNCPVGAGLLRASMTIPSPLLIPGDYSVIAGIITPRGEIIDVVKNVTPFSVRDSGRPFSAPKSKAHGMVLVDAEWQVHAAHNDC